MSWIERLLYFFLIFGLYCVGRWQSENRAIIHRALDAKETAKALNENRISDIQYKLQNDINVCLYNSYTSYSFGPNLWQKPLPKEKISFTIETVKPTPPNSHTQSTPEQPAPEPTAVTSTSTAPEETAPVSNPQ